MQTENSNLIIFLNNTILPLCDWLFLPAGLIWFSYTQSHDIISVVLSSSIYYVLFQIVCFVANFLIAILYAIFIPIFFFFHKVKEIVILLHVVFFTTYTIFAYDFALEFSPNNVKPISLLLYAFITLPFICYVQKNFNNISDVMISYIATLKVSTLISCLSLLIFNVDIYAFGMIFVISYLCGIPFIKHAMGDSSRINNLQFK